MKGQRNGSCQDLLMIKGRKWVGKLDPGLAWATVFFRGGNRGLIRGPLMDRR